MTDRKQPAGTETPAVARLRGVLKDAGLVGEGDYAAHLEEKHLRDGEAHEDARGHKRRGPLRRPSAKQSEQDGDEQPGILDLFGTLEWDESYDYKLERSRRLRSRRLGGLALVLALALAALAAPQAAAQELDADDADHPGRTFRDSLASGGDGPEMVVVPAGSFRMGCVSGVDCYPGREEPVHEVTIPRPFAVGSHEVTFAEWDACVSAGGCEHRPDDRGWGRDRRPVINVSWQDAQEYVSWLSGETGAAYRLPSESEWEYAARAGSNTAYAWGDEIGSGRANCAGCRGGWSHQTAPAGSFPPNSWGLHDMHGNVWEWVEDCWHESYDGAAPDGAARQSDDCSRHALRGGSWDAGRALVRSASRFGHGSGIRVGYLGFRVARTLAP